MNTDLLREKFAAIEHAHWAKAIISVLQTPLDDEREQSLLDLAKTPYAELPDLYKMVPRVDADELIAVEMPDMEQAQTAIMRAYEVLNEKPDKFGASRRERALYILSEAIRGGLTNDFMLLRFRAERAEADEAQVRYVAKVQGDAASKQIEALETTIGEMEKQLAKFEDLKIEGTIPPKAIFHIMGVLVRRAGGEMTVAHLDEYRDDRLGFSINVLPDENSVVIKAFDGAGNPTAPGVVETPEPMAKLSLLYRVLPFLRSRHSKSTLN